MDFRKLIETRYSARAYKPDPVPDELLHQVLDAARLAPTAANRQAFQVIVIHTEGRQEELQHLYQREWFVEAPLILGVCMLPSEAWRRSPDGQSYSFVDAAIIMDHMVLTAAELGLGTCWVAAFDPQAAREILGLPDDVVPVIFTPLGYAADSPKPKTRKALEDLVRYERW
ncbi:MAG: nitroreductase family protein [Anaerolineae bacterium]|nr:nitroreductase family protein [Anaerolineae bacterium]